MEDRFGEAWRKVQLSDFRGHIIGRALLVHWLFRPLTLFTPARGGSSLLSLPNWSREPCRGTAGVSCSPSQAQADQITPGLATWGPNRGGPSSAGATGSQLPLILGGSFPGPPGRPPITNGALQAKEVPTPGLHGKKSLNQTWNLLPETGVHRHQISPWTCMQEQADGLT